MHPWSVLTKAGTSLLISYFCSVMFTCSVPSMSTHLLTTHALQKTKSHALGQLKQIVLKFWIWLQIQVQTYLYKAMLPAMKCISLFVTMLNSNELRRLSTEYSAGTDRVRFVYESWLCSTELSWEGWVLSTVLGLTELGLCMSHDFAQQQWAGKAEYWVQCWDWQS